MFGYPLADVKKTVIEAIFAIAAVVAFFIQYDPGLPNAIAVLALAAFGVAAVFNARQRSWDDISKSIMALVTAGVALYGFFNTYEVGETEKIIAIAGALLNVGGVFWATNVGARSRFIGTNA